MAEILKIKKLAFEGIMWRGGYQLFHQIASIIVKIILVRILLPEDFGFIAMAMIVFESLDIINRFAGGEPFIRDNTSDVHKAKNTLFYLNLVSVGLTILICIVSAPYITKFFAKNISESQSISTLLWIIRILALRLCFSILASVPIAILIKDLRFKELYWSNAAGTFAYIITAPILAFIGFGVWAIVLAHILEQIVITGLFLYHAPFVPAFSFDKQIGKKYIKYNSNIFAGSLVIMIITQGDDTVIGRLMGPSILGFYNIGQQLAAITLSIISSNINEVIFPVLSKFQNDKEMFTKAFYKSFRLTIFSAIPCIAGLIILARELVICFFGEKWLPMLPAFYILSIATLCYTIVNTAGPVFNSLNMPHLNRNCQFIKLVLFVVLIVPFSKTWGYIGVCWVMVVLSTVPVIYLTPKLAKEIDGLYGYMFKTLSKSLIFTILMLISIYLFKKIIPINNFYLFMSVILGVATYGIPILLFDKESKDDMRFVLNLAKEKFQYAST